ncbi:MAG: UMP kinase, partial [Leptospiraceae bacterium]|nr:UMP kinase [Leptospiraceae bacterium]
MNTGFPYDRVLIKLSGEAFTTPGKTGIDYARVAVIAEEIQQCHEAGMKLAVVIGGGNILRGQEAAEHGMERATADYMGMLATVINALALQEACEKIGMVTRVQTAIEMQNIAE